MISQIFGCNFDRMSNSIWAVLYEAHRNEVAVDRVDVGIVYLVLCSKVSTLKLLPDSNSSTHSRFLASGATLLLSKFAHNAEMQNLACQASSL